jgi:GT2 family glycosyltransferase
VQTDNSTRSKILWRDRLKAWRGQALLFVLWLFKTLIWLPPLRKAYHGTIIHLIKKTGIFDRDYYLDTNKDVPEAEMTPLRHYVIHGDRQRRPPLALFDPDYYRVRAKCLLTCVNALLHYTLVGRYLRISPSPWFDIDFYLAINKDVARAGFDPLHHFLNWGGTEGRSPSPQFDGAYYLRTNPQVAQSRINPLIHYLRMGRFKGRPTMPSENDRCAQIVVGSRMCQAAIPADDAWASLTPRADIRHAAVDVVVPVYKGRAETLRCLYSVFNATSATAFELVVIDDASPDATLVADLQRLADQKRFTLLTNPENRGFVHTVNRGVALHPERDVVLLNADTEVFDGWLDRLRQAAYRRPRTATVTPLSNNATICSYPRFLQDNPFPLELGYDELDALTAEVNAAVEVEAPTGVGFCMFLKRAALADVGPFDEASFGRGYGEENDFCQRAIRKHWRNVIAADVFVHHWGATSFQEKKTKRIQAALKAMDRLHPRYQRDVAAFIDRDPLADARRRLNGARLLRLRRSNNTLIVNHNRGGGAERKDQEEIQRFNEDGFINLAGVDGMYCHEPNETACNRCLADAGSDFGVLDIVAWRRMHHRALLAADTVRVPDPDAAEGLGRYFPDVTFEVLPHEDIDTTQITPCIPKLWSQEKLRIAVIGAIGKIKGFELFLACARHARKQQLPLRFMLMGYSMNDRQLRDAGVRVTGRYLDENAHETLRALTPHVVWLPYLWPETYSYTLSIALRLGLPVIAFDIGAIALRIGECDPSAGHRLLPLALAKQPDEVNLVFEAFRSDHLAVEQMRKVG